MIKEEKEEIFKSLPKGLETYGDLKKVINGVIKKQKLGKVGNVALDAAIGVIPGVGAAKTGYDFIKAAFGKPDTKKTNTWLDKLDVDDDASAIVDDTIENDFINNVATSIEKAPDDAPLEDDFSMNNKLVKHLSNKFNSRTLKGIKENKMKISELKQLVKEEILKENKPKETPQLQNLSALLQKLKLDKLDEKNFKAAAFQGTRSVAIDKSVATIFLKLLATDNQELAGIFTAIKAIKSKNKG